LISPAPLISECLSKHLSFIDQRAMMVANKS